MAVLLESPWYRQILLEGEKRGEKRGVKLGEKRGEERGVKLGEERGEKKGLLSGIAMGLELRFGDEGLQLLPEIQTLDRIEILETILVAIKTVGSLEELRRVYGES